jgi:hypothetical protein
MKSNGHALVESRATLPLSAPDQPKSLVAKLSEACDAVGGIAKSGRNKTQGYDYVKFADVAKAIRHELFSRGVVIIPSESELQTERIETNSGGWMTEARLKSTYTVTDGHESLSFDAWGVARDSGDKAVYKAKSGALKYFLRSLGLIPDEKDDVEADETVDHPDNAPARKSPTTAPAGDVLKIADFQKNAFLSAAKKSGKTNDQLIAYYKTLGISELSEMPRKDFQAALLWAMNAEAA